MKRIVRVSLQIVGVLAILTGLLWVGQGLGLVRWPAQSFMIDLRPWAWRGAVLALAGLVTLFLSRRTYG